jgi:hypothetical protein
MIYEYALEPELVATWSDRRIGRYFIEKFGLGQPRVVSRYPRAWKRLVWEAFAGGNDLDRKRMEELLARLCEVMVKRRAGVWTQSQTWLANAEAEHARSPFHAILARQNSRKHPRVLIADDLDERATHWDLPRGVTVGRTAASMAATVKSMLRAAESVFFVDPYFGPERPRHRRSLRAFLRALMDGRPSARPQRIQIFTSIDSTGTKEFFEEECRRSLSTCIPVGVRLSICRLRQKPNGERLHNRYILTDLGGVIFGVGLDEGEEGATDDIELLERAQYEKRWQQYVGDPGAFDRPEPNIDL